MLRFSQVLVSTARPRLAVFEMAGARQSVCLNRLVNGELSLSDYDIMAIEGASPSGTT